MAVGGWLALVGRLRFSPEKVRKWKGKGVIYPRPAWLASRKPEKQFTRACRQALAENPGEQDERSVQDARHQYDAAEFPGEILRVAFVPFHPAILLLENRFEVRGRRRADDGVQANVEPEEEREQNQNFEDDHSVAMLSAGGVLESQKYL